MRQFESICALTQEISIRQPSTHSSWISAPTTESNSAQSIEDRQYLLECVTFQNVCQLQGGAELKLFIICNRRRPRCRSHSAALTRLGNAIFSTVRPFSIG